MKTNILLPKRIKVGFNKRSDTYSGTLAYIIYYDEKGKLRKETSWDNWRDKKIDSQEFDNTPTSGFVLNKKVGGYKSDWNFRQAYCRVWDPRGFEFEITVPNLLYILENTSSIRGKGLEGEFVYCWDGKDLVLLPTCAPEYEKITAFTEMVTDKEKISKKNIVLGGTYKTNKDEEWIYLGHFDKYEEKYYDDEGRSDRVWKSIGKRHFFMKSDKEHKYDSGLRFASGLSNLVKTVSDKAHPDYAKMMSKLEYQSEYSPVDPTKDQYVDITDKQLNSMLNGRAYLRDLYFEIDGFLVKADIHEDYQHKGNFNIGDLHRVHKLDSLWSRHDYGYSHRGKQQFYWNYNEDRDTELNKIIAHLKKEKYLRDYDYYTRKFSKSWTLEELNETFKFKVKQQYLANGKKYKEERYY